MFISVLIGSGRSDGLSDCQDVLLVLLAVRKGIVIIGAISAFENVIDKGVKGEWRKLWKVRCTGWWCWHH